MGQQTPSARLIIDTAKVTAAERLDAKYLVATSDSSMPAGEVALGYKTCRKPNARSET